MAAPVLPGGCMKQGSGRFGRVRKNAAKSTVLTTLALMCISVAVIAISSTIAPAFALTSSSSTQRPSSALRGALAMGTQTRVGLTSFDRQDSNRIGLHATATATSVRVEDPWIVLGVSRSASPADIKKAYRKRALVDHPDVSRSPDAIGNWLILSEAYATLSDPDKLAQWKVDRMSQQWSSGGSNGRSTVKDWADGIRKSQETTSRWRNRDYNPFGTGVVGVVTAAAGVAGEVADEAFIGGLAVAMDAFSFAKKTHETAEKDGLDSAANIAMNGGMVLAGKAVNVVGNVARLTTTGTIGIAGRAAETVFENISPAGREVAMLTLEDLLSLLGHGSSDDPQSQKLASRRLQDRIDAVLSGEFGSWKKVDPSAN